MKTIKMIDPVTRIEGHMKVELTVDQRAGESSVVDARCSGTLFRGFEEILTNRDAWDAPVLTQRICGVCPISHGQAAVLNLENASGWYAASNARLLRNLTVGANFLQSHILHFYLLAALDFVPGPGTSPWSPAWDVDTRPGAESVAANLGKALEARRMAHEMGAVFSGRMPTSHAFIPGGFTALATREGIAEFRARLSRIRGFIRDVYIPDVKKIAGIYPDYFDMGRACENLLAYGAFELDDSYTERLFRPGYREAGSLTVRTDFDPADLTESVACSWYRDGAGSRHPSEGETVPLYPKGDSYSWLKAPRLNGRPCEVGPLARMIINGDYGGRVSVMDRHRARAFESAKVARAMDGWLDELLEYRRGCDDGYVQYDGRGAGLTEAPRGSLGHWSEIAKGKVAHYQIVTPTCWNASPRDEKGIPGPMEQALIGTPVQDPDRPIEALRIIHSFDPCLSCAVHVMRPEGDLRAVRTIGTGS